MFIVSVAIYNPRLQTDFWRMIFQRLPVMFQKIYRILMGQRHEIHVLFLMQLILLVENMIANLTVPVEISTNNVSVTITETLYNLYI